MFGLDFGLDFGFPMILVTALIIWAWVSFFSVVFA